MVDFPPVCSCSTPMKVFTVQLCHQDVGHTRPMNFLGPRRHTQPCEIHPANAERPLMQRSKLNKQELRNDFPIQSYKVGQTKALSEQPVLFCTAVYYTAVCVVPHVVIYLDRPGNPQPPSPAPRFSASIFAYVLFYTAPVLHDPGSPNYIE